MVLAIVVNNDGLPFYWEVLPGGTADATTITWLLEKTGKRFKVNNTTLVFDRGMVSNDNLARIEGDGIKYISAMDKNQIEEITRFDFNQFSHFDPQHINKQIEDAEGFKKLRADTWYSEATTSGTRRYILCFNPQLFKDQRKTREQAITDFHAFAANLNAELLEAKKSRQYEATYKKFKKGAARYKLSKFISISLATTTMPGKTDGTKIITYQGGIVVDEDKKKTAARLDGFWLLVTNQIEKKGDDFLVSAKEAISPYREKVIIEAAFRDIKSFVEVSPVFVWTEAHVKAHYTILTANNLRSPKTRQKRPEFYQKLRRETPNGLVSIDEVKVNIEGQIIKLNLEMAVDTNSFAHTAFSISQKETSEEFIKVIKSHCLKWGTPVGIVSDSGSANLSDVSKKFLDFHDIKHVPAGPANLGGLTVVQGDHERRWIRPRRVF